MIVTYRGETWGGIGTSVHVISAAGLEDFSAASSSMSVFADGSRATALRLGMRTWILDLLVLADDADGMATELAAVRAVTWPSVDRFEVYPFTFELDGEVAKTAFARCVSQQIPTEFETADRYIAARCQFAFEAYDLQLYGDEEAETLDVDDALVVTGTVPTGEGRIRAVIAGPVTNPQLSSSLADSAVVRYVGEVAAGDNLVVEWSPSYLLTKVASDADLAGVASPGVGTHCYGALDGGAAVSRPPQFFPLTAGAQTITYTASAGTGECVLTYRLPVL